MKKTAILFFSLLCTATLYAQGLPQAILGLTVQEVPSKRAITSAQAVNGASTTFWSEDFANGIPADWTQLGTPSIALWEYRGPSTFTNNTQGSIGYYSGVNNTPQTNDPLASATASNGFIIFDSGYLDNGGTSVLQSGAAPAPHVGRLFTDTINLSLQPQVELTFQTDARRVYARFLVAFSIDGGVTFNDTLNFLPESIVPIGGQTLNGTELTAIVSNIIGGQANVVMQFIFDGTPTVSGVSGHYYWMIDDIELRTPPANQMFFTNWNGAPAHDMIYNSNGAAYPKYGIINSNQIVPVEFDSNILNYGTQAQTNVTVNVEIWDVPAAGAPSLVTTLSAPGCPTLASGDTCTYIDLNTPTWTPPSQAADYLIVYKAVSDSINAMSINEADTFNFFVRDLTYSTDRNSIDNYVGTNSAIPDIIALGVLFSLENEDPLNAGGGLIYINGASIELSPQTDSTADIQIDFWDTTGLAFNAGIPSSTIPIFRKVFALNGSLIGGNAFFDFSTNGQTLALPANTYLMMVNLFPNATDGVVRIANDASFDQPGFSTVMQSSDGNWYSGFAGPTHEGTFIRLDIGVFVSSIKESELDGFNVYPVPSNGTGFVEFDNGGEYTITILDIIGNPIFTKQESVNANERIDFDITKYPAGVYLVNITGEDTYKTVKITVQ